MQTLQHQRSSLMSNTSRSLISGLAFGRHPDHLTNAELIKLVNDLKEEVNILKLENQILENTILRVEPSLMLGIYQALEYVTRMNSGTSLAAASFIKSTSRSLADTLLSPSRMVTSSSRASTRKESLAKIGGTIIFGAGPRINILERAELVSVEMTRLVNNLDKVRTRAAKQHAILKAKQEEIGIRMNDVDKASKMFKQDVLIEGWDKIAQRIPAEIWIRFMTEWAKTTDSQIGKLRLRTSTLNTQYSKLKGQIKAKEELSESLRPVDFEKLKIENGERLKLIDHKLQQLGELKKMTGDANLNLTIHKEALLEQNCYLSKVMTSIKNKERLTVKLDNESDQIQLQVDVLSQKLKKLKKVRMQYKVPDVFDYVKVKWEVTDLRHAIKILENRVHIQQIALTSINKKLRTMSETG